MSKKTYKIIDNTDLQVQYTFIASNTLGIKHYELINNNGGTLFYATDTEDEMIFEQKIPKRMEFDKLGQLYTFLKLIDFSDKQLFESHTVCEEIENI